MKRLFNYLFAVQPLTVSERKAIIKRNYDRYGYKPNHVRNYVQPLELAAKIDQLLKPVNFKHA